MMFRPVLLLAAAVGLLAAACGGGAGATPVRTTAPIVTTAPSAAASTVSVSTAGYFVGPNGMTLYTFDKDYPGGKSVCNGECLAKWPALSTTAGSAITVGTGLTSTDFATITRDDGSLQVAFKDIPLYYFAADTAPGQTNGEGVGGVWHTATTSSTLPEPAPSAGPSTAASAAPSASAGAEGIEVETGGDGAYLVGPEGMTLYIFDNDGAGPESTCYDDCAAAWPPLLVADEDEGAVGGEGVDGAFGITERTDDTYQVTYNGLPLYYFAGDQAVGDTNGDGVGEVWHLAQP